ncbi:hypothetical protein ACHAQE_010204 [Botrytis cinerea]|uniref:Uncharacterized protein n=1 Tax=Botryotinia fuckeliana (strain T4) TaxID=999810 RepID=G2YD95_BOTF4|nr:hypothetical protein BofuT4_P094510.1 [Botrytis cinerea T4]
MPAVERIFMASSISTHNYEIAVETVKKFPNLKSLATRTNGVDTEDVTYHSSGVVTGANNIPPSLKVRMNQLWNSDEWKAIRAYGQIPELWIYTIDELCSGLILPFGPSNIIKHQQTSSEMQFKCHQLVDPNE